MIKLRAHHLVCLSRANCSGGWYNIKLKRRVLKILHKIKGNPNLKIKLIKKCDDICIKCPYQNKRICEKRPKINYWIVVMDNKFLKKFKLKENSIHKAKDIFNLVLKRINNKDLKQICKGCKFLRYCLKLGLNMPFVKLIMKNDPS